MNAQQVLDRARECGIMIVTAESCTGGLIAAALTDVAGSSAAFDRGFVTYSNDAKIDMLGVSADLVASRGAVSAEVAEAMATGALDRSNATLSVAVTGIAGPGGGTAAKPVGLVFIASAMTGGRTLVREYRFAQEHGTGVTRSTVRRETVRQALRLLGDQLIEAPTP